MTVAGVITRFFGRGGAVHTDRVPAWEAMKRRVDAASLGVANVTSTAVGAGQGGTYNRMLTLPFMPYKMRVYLTTPQNIASGAGSVTLALDTVDFDNVSGWNAATSTYTIPISGYYFVTLAVAWAPVGVIKWLIGNSHVNWTNLSTSVTTGIVSTNVVNGTYPAPAAITVGTNYNSGLSDLQYFNVGDTLVPRVSQQNDAALAMNVIGGWGSTFMTAHLVST